MTLPVLINGPWTFSVNHDCTETVANDTRKHALWQLKESLISFAAWSVVASSDSISVKNIGDASPDLWITWANVVGGTSAHAWVVLENSTTGEQVCLDVANPSYHNLNCIYSATGSFSTDGTTTTRPTDTESYVLYPITSYWFESAADGAIVHAMISADNKITRWYIHQRRGAAHGGWFIGLEEMKNPPAVWTSTHKRASFAAVASISSADLSTAQYPRASELSTSIPRWICYQKDSTPYEGWNLCSSTAECSGGLYNNDGKPFYKNTVLQTWLGGYPVSPIGIYREDTLRGGSMGRIQDMYWGQESHFTYDTYDGVGSKEWIKFGCFMVPWDGSTPLDVP